MGSPTPVPAPASASLNDVMAKLTTIEKNVVGSPSPSSDPVVNPSLGPPPVMNVKLNLPTPSQTPAQITTSTPAQIATSTPATSSYTYTLPPMMNTSNLADFQNQSDQTLVNYAANYYPPNHFPKTTSQDMLNTYYTDALVTGFSPAIIDSSYTIPGNRYFLNTYTPCLDSSGNQQPRSVLVDNVLTSSVKKSNDYGNQGLLYSLFASLDNINTPLQDACGGNPLNLPIQSQTSTVSGSLFVSDLPQCAPVSVYINGGNTTSISGWMIDTDITKVDPLALVSNNGVSEGFDLKIDTDATNSKNHELFAQIMVWFYIIALIIISAYMIYRLMKKQ